MSPQRDYSQGSDPGTSQSWTRGFSPLFRGLYSDQHLRVSDAERQAVADRLAEHFADGRLDQAEFDDRVGRAMSAKTRADLSGLFSDLPDTGAPAVPDGPRRRPATPCSCSSCSSSSPRWPPTRCGGPPGPCCGWASWSWPSCSPPGPSAGPGRTLNRQCGPNEAWSQPRRTSGAHRGGTTLAFPVRARRGAAGSASSPARDSAAAGSPSTSSAVLGGGGIAEQSSAWLGRRRDRRASPARGSGAAGSPSSPARDSGAAGSAEQSSA